MRRTAKSRVDGLTAVAVLTKHFDAVSRGDPEALELERQVNDALRAEEARRARVASLARALVGLTDEGLDKVEAIVREHEAGKAGT